MDGVGVRLTRGTDVLGRVEIGRNLDERVGGLGMERTEVVRRCHGDRLDPLGTAGAEDAQRDLPTVRDEQPAHPRESRLPLAERLVRLGAVGSSLASSFEVNRRWYCGCA